MYIPSLPGTIDVDNPIIKPKFYGATMGNLDMPMKDIDKFYMFLVLVAVITTSIVCVIKLKTETFREKLTLSAIMIFICIINLGSFYSMSIPN